MFEKENREVCKMIEDKIQDAIDRIEDIQFNVHYVFFQNPTCSSYPIEDIQFNVHYKESFEFIKWPIQVEYENGDLAVYMGCDNITHELNCNEYPIEYLIEVYEALNDFRDSLCEYIEATIERVKKLEEDGG